MFLHVGVLGTIRLYLLHATMLPQPKWSLGYIMLGTASYIPFSLLSFGVCFMVGLYFITETKQPQVVV